MRIQHNISALNTHRNLAFNNTQTSKALEKLSSGYKINRAGDDAAGLAISEKMRGQIRGLDMAAKNAQDGISLIQTTEGALNETHSILQRMRELAVQAGNDTNTADDRGEIQKEINQLTSEINRIGNTTEFNTKKLLNGELSDKHVVTAATAGTVSQVDVAKGQVAKVGNNPVAWNTTPQVAAGTNVTFTGAASNGMAWNDLDTDEANKLTIDKAANGDMLVTVSATDAGTAGAVKTLAIDAKKMAFEDTTKTYNFDHEGIKFSLTKDQVDNWKTGEKATVDLNLGAAAGGTVNVTANAIDLGATVQDFTTKTAAATGRSMTDITVTGGHAELLNGATQVKVNYDGAKLTVDLQDAANASVAKYEYSLAASTAHTFNENGISFTFNGGTDTNVEGTFKLATEKKDITTGGTSAVTSDESIKFQIGANKDQALTVSVSDMRAEALGIVGEAGTTGFTTAAGVNDGTNNDLDEAALDVSTHENAANAIKVLDDAIIKVSSERAKLGAVQNRLEHTINNLGASSENLTAAESRIRDTDMAKEMMNFTKNNILTQAAQSMLAQANQQPQGVLQLLG